jgi:hypothetical protein
VVFRGDRIGYVVGCDVDARSSIHTGDLPGHRHRAGVSRVVGDKVNRLHDPYAGDDIDEASFDDIGVGRGFAPESGASP